MRNIMATISLAVVSLLPVLFHCHEKIVNLTQESYTFQDFIKNILKIFGLNLHGMSSFELESVLRRIYRIITISPLTQKEELDDFKSGLKQDNSLLLARVKKMKLL
jgi:hypothetical protein